MENNIKWNLDEAEKNALIRALSPELTVLRTKADISQGELANIIGVSRQTYGAIERGSREMTWNTYLSLILFYDYNLKTHDIIRSLGIFPKELVTRFNDGHAHDDINLSLLFCGNSEDIINCLDEQAFHSIRTMIMVEYARCTGVSGEAVVKSFDDIKFVHARTTADDITATQAIKAIRKKSNEQK